MAARRKKKRAYHVWTDDELKRLRNHSRRKTPVAKLPRVFKGRQEQSIRMKAYQLGIPLGHRRRANAR